MSRTRFKSWLKYRAQKTRCDDITVIFRDLEPDYLLVGLIQGMPGPMVDYMKTPPAGMPEII